MKKIFNPALFFAIVILVTACKKTINPNSSPENVFVENIDNIQRSEPVLLSFGDTNNTAITDWTIIPDTDVSISKVGSYATLNFRNAGVYYVIAKANGKQATYIITVNNNVFSDLGSGFSLTASKIVQLHQNEEITFTVNNAVSNNIVWTVSNNAGVVNIAADKKSAIISFASGKTGTVTVSDGINKQSRAVWLNDNVIDKTIDTVPFILGEKINITPSVLTDTNGIKTLSFSANTTYKYQCNSDKVLSLAENNNNEFKLSYGGVVMSAEPCSSITTASSKNSFVNASVGSHPFTVNIENKTYTGTVDVSAAGVFSFNWTNNSAVSIYPLKVQ